MNFFAEKHGKSPVDAHFGALSGYHSRYSNVVGDIWYLADVVKAFEWGHRKASEKREKLGLPIAPLWLIQYCAITEYAPYDQLQVPYIESTYALTSAVRFTPKGNRNGVDIRDRVFTDAPVGEGRLLDGTVKPMKKPLSELAPRCTRA